MTMKKVIAALLAMVLMSTGCAMAAAQFEPAKPELPADYLHSDEYTNAEKCFLYFTADMGLSEAAACGIMANIYKESTFNPEAGSSYYGLVQWGGGRKTNLHAFCKENGFSSATMEGQLNFLEHELNGAYASVLEYLNSVPNTAQGAFDAAYHFCYYFERPSNKVAKSNSRGALAQDTYFPEYAAA